MDFDVHYIYAQLPALWRGLLMTLEVSCLSIAISVLVGIAGAAIKVMRVPLLTPAINAYVEFIRNTPLLAQMFFIYFGLPGIGLTLSLFWSGVLTLSLWAGAYQIENIRGGLNTVRAGLQNASFALGMRPWQYMRLIAMPLALRTSQASVLNTSISCLKNSCFLQAVGLAEITYVAMDKVAMDFRTLEMMLVLGVTYLTLVLLMSLLSAWLEHRLHKPFRM
ncbi:amino acid ABC transporter permease [Herbaspirillum lusitanum]|uniref:Amino acid ABC transporter permease n=1 Tax=Herbaspirillum lusitanum TaxID=213312 RepID=A0ABW9AFL8_9BURK